MRSSGNPETPYSVVGKTADSLQQIFAPADARSQKLLKLGIFLPLIVGFFASLLGIILREQPYGIQYYLHGWLGLLLPLIAAYGFIKRKEQVAVHATAFFWASILVTATEMLSRYSWISYLTLLLTLLLFVTAALVLLEEGLPPALRRLTPLVKLMTYGLVVFCAVLDVGLFLYDISTFYRYPLLLVLPLGSALLFLMLTGDFDRDRWMQPVKKLLPPLFIVILLVLSLLEAVLGWVSATKNAIYSAPYLFFEAPVAALFFIGMILPTYLLLVRQQRFPKTRTSAKPAERRSAPIEEIPPQEEVVSMLAEEETVPKEAVEPVRQEPVSLHEVPSAYEPLADYRQSPDPLPEAAPGEPRAWEPQLQNQSQGQENLVRPLARTAVERGEGEMRPVRLPIHSQRVDAPEGTPPPLKRV